MKNNIIFGLFILFTFFMASCSSASKEEAAAVSALAGSTIFSGTDTNSLSIDTTAPSSSEEACSKSGKTISTVSDIVETETYFSFNMKFEFDKCTEEVDLTSKCDGGKKIDVITDGTIDMPMEYSQVDSVGSFKMKGSLNIKAENLNTNCDMDLTISTNSNDEEFTGKFCGYTYEELDAYMNDASKQAELCAVIFN